MRSRHELPAPATSAAWPPHGAAASHGCVVRSIDLCQSHPLSQSHSYSHTCTNPTQQLCSLSSYAFHHVFFSLVELPNKAQHVTEGFARRVKISFQMPQTHNVLGVDCALRHRLRSIFRMRSHKPDGLVNPAWQLTR